MDKLEAEILSTILFYKWKWISQIYVNDLSKTQVLVPPY